MPRYPAPCLAGVCSRGAGGRAAGVFAERAAGREENGRSPCAQPAPGRQTPWALPSRRGCCRGRQEARRVERARLRSSLARSRPLGGERARGRGRPGGGAGAGAGPTGPPPGAGLAAAHGGSRGPQGTAACGARGEGSADLEPPGRPAPSPHLPGPPLGTAQSGANPRCHRAGGRCELGSPGASG